MIEETNNEALDIDEVELTLRRFAMNHSDQALTKLLNSMFPTTEAKENENEN